MTRLALALVLAAAVTGCGKDATTPTSASTPTGAALTATRLFSGTLAARDTQFYSFTVAQQSGVFVTLASVTATDNRAATTTSVGIGLGVPRGTECAMSTRAVVTSALTPQVREIVAPGVHCVAIYDPGTLPAAVNYAVRIGYFQ
ncbi:MAG: hypothetical protein ABI880_16600 [Acidobacteriota bacterium]